MSEQAGQASEQSSSSVRVRTGSGRERPVDDATSFAGARTMGHRRCSSCGTFAPAHANVCLECGASLQTQKKVIRCRQCRQQASVELVLCPNCGRELIPAPPLIVTWGAPVVLVVMFLLVIIARWESGNPVTWFRSTISQGASLAVEFGERVEPDVSFVITPVPAQVAQRTMVQAPSTEIDAAAPLAGGVVEGNSDGQTGQEIEAGVDEVDANAETIAAVPGVEDDTVSVPAGEVGAMSETPTPAATDLPTATALPTATDTPAEQPTLIVLATSTALSASDEVATRSATRAAIVKAGEEAVLASIDLPTATRQPPAPSPSSTFTPSPVPVVTYEIQAGDTMIGIAARYDISTEALMRANGISANEAYTIQPGQTLIIPGNTDLSPESTATNTATAQPTATPAAVAAATATPTDMDLPIRLDAPKLRSPEDATPMSCHAQTTLVWLGVPYIKVEDKYILHVGYVSGMREGGEEEITWLLYQHVPSQRTSWDLDGDQYCQYGDKQFGRQWRWWVEVVEEVNGNMISVSPPSEVWGFSWN